RRHVGQDLAVVAREHLAVGVQIGQVDHRLVGKSALGRHRLLAPDIERAEPAREGELLLAGEALVAEDQHRVLVDRRLELVDGLAVDRLGQVDAEHLGAELRIEGVDRQRHGYTLTARAPTGNHTPFGYRSAMDHSTGPTVAETLAAAIAEVRPDRLPAGMRAMAHNMVLDIIGLCLAARRTDYIQAAL